MLVAGRFSIFGGRKTSSITSETETAAPAAASPSQVTTQLLKSLSALSPETKTLSSIVSTSNSPVDSSSNSCAGSLMSSIGTKEGSEGDISENDTSGDTTVDRPGDTAVDTPGDTAVDTPGDTAVDKPGDTTVDTSGDTTVDTFGDTTVGDATSELGVSGLTQLVSMGVWDLTRESAADGPSADTSGAACVLMIPVVLQRTAEVSVVSGIKQKLIIVYQQSIKDSVRETASEFTKVILLFILYKAVVKTKHLSLHAIFAFLVPLTN